MIDENRKYFLLSGAKNICKFVGEDPNKIIWLVENEGLPAWKRPCGTVWKALNVDLEEWMVSQRKKYFLT